MPKKEIESNFLFVFPIVEIGKSVSMTHKYKNEIYINIQKSLVHCQPFFTEYYMKNDTYACLRLSEYNEPSDEENEKPLSAFRWKQPEMDSSTKTAW